MLLRLVSVADSCGLFLCLVLMDSAEMQCRESAEKCSDLPTAGVAGRRQVLRTLAVSVAAPPSEFVLQWTKQSKHCQRNVVRAKTVNAGSVRTVARNSGGNKSV